MLLPSILMFVLTARN